MHVHTSDLSDDFFTKLNAMCVRLGCNPVDMLAVMNRESGIDPTAHNKDGTPNNESDDAWGLNQIMSFHFAAGQYGWERGRPAHEFITLSAAEQLPYVEGYFSPYAKCGLTSVGALYAFNFLPGRALDRGCSPGTVLTSEGESFYDHNSGLDFDKDGHISILDLTNEALSRAVGARWHEAEKRLSRAVAGEADTPEEGVASLDLSCVEGQQCALSQLGYECEVDGVWGPQSAEACRSFQIDHVGLNVDGICGPHTQIELRNALTKL